MHEVFPHPFPSSLGAEVTESREENVQSARRHLKISQVYLTDIILYNSLYMYNNPTHATGLLCLISIVFRSLPLLPAPRALPCPSPLRPSADSRDALSLSFLSFLSPAAKEQREQQQLQLNSPLLPLIVVSVCLFGPSCQS